PPFPPGRIEDRKITGVRLAGLPRLRRCSGGLRMNRGADAASEKCKQQNTMSECPEHERLDGIRRFSAPPEIDHSVSSQGRCSRFRQEGSHSVRCHDGDSESAAVTKDSPPNSN